MAYSKIVSAREVPGEGIYDIYEVKPIAGAVGGGPRQYAPFIPESPSALAVAELAAAGISGAFQADVGNGFVHVYVTTPGTEPPGPISPELPGVNPGEPNPLPGPGDAYVPPTIAPEHFGPGGPYAPGGGHHGLQLPWEQATWDANSWLGQLVSWFASNVPEGTCSAEQWATFANPQEALAASGHSCIAFIAEGWFKELLQLLPHPPIWAYWDGKWKAPLNACPDPPVGIQEGSQVGNCGTGGEPPPLPPTTTGGHTMMGFDLQGTPPTTYVARKCGKAKVLAVDGLCYWKKLLPAALRMNKSRRAPVSWSDAQNIRKGEQASKRIKAYGKRIEKSARKLAPPVRRRKLPPPKTNC